jgi:hydrogenase maturation protein HypF
VLSQHLGDLETEAALRAFRGAIDDLRRLFGLDPSLVVTDLHPDYLSTREAGRLGRPGWAVQHHHAHVLACMAENELTGPVLGVAWDGTGHGPDGTVWGGEFLATDTRGFRRFAAFRPFPLPGGDRAIREPRRAALGILFEILGEAACAASDLPTLRAFAPGELAALRTMLARGVQTPRTTSAGRLFDAVASLAGLRQVNAFEGQAALALEWALAGTAGADPYPCAWRPAGPDPGAVAGDARPQWWIDWEPLVRAVVADVRAGAPAATVARRFHDGLSRVIGEAAERAGLERVVLTGGCFQNAALLEGALAVLRPAGFRVYWPQRVPPNDGGIALGQAVAELWRGAAGGNSED